MNIIVSYCIAAVKENEGKCELTTQCDHQAAKDTENAKVFNNIFLIVFTGEV